MYTRYAANACTRRARQKGYLSVYSNCMSTQPNALPVNWFLYTCRDLYLCACVCQCVCVCVLGCHMLQLRACRHERWMQHMHCITHERCMHPTRAVHAAHAARASSCAVARLLAHKRCMLETRVLHAREHDRCMLQCMLEKTRVQLTYTPAV